jgi:lipoate-protein ligase A
MSGKLRVIDAGCVGALRSQALWHGIAEAMARGDDAVLSFCRPAAPYVCLGYHRSLDELDQGACRELGLPVLRRQIGGGPVYLDADQLFFQISLPVADAPAGVHRLYELLLEPAAAALRSLGVPARVSSTNDIVAGGRKVSGTGAGQIADGVVVVGNIMFGFPHERMAAVLRLPDEEMRSECLRLMRLHVGALPGLREAPVKAALSNAYADGLGLTAVPDELQPREHAAIARWARRLDDPAWIAGPSHPPLAGRQVKVRAGVWVYDGAEAQLRVRATVEDWQVTDARVVAPHLNGTATELAGALLGACAEREALRSRLQGFGEDGMRVLHALEPGLVVR